MTPHSISKDMKYSQEIVLKHFEHFKNNKRVKDRALNLKKVFCYGWWEVSSESQASIFSKGILDMGEGFLLPLGSLMPLTYTQFCLGKKIEIPHKGISVVFVISLIMIT